MPLPLLDATGDLPPGVHRNSLRELLERFGVGTPQRRRLSIRLQRVYELAVATGRLDRAIVFGSFVSAKAEPNDVDLFLVMEDTFDLNGVSGEGRVVFDHPAAQAHFGASVFWVRHAACFPSEDELVSGWALKRDGTKRGIVELVMEAT